MKTSVIRMVLVVFVLFAEATYQQSYAFDIKGCSYEVNAPSNVQQPVRNSEDLKKALSIANKQGRSEKLTINVAANTYTLQDTFRISQSNVSIIAEPGTKVVLADHVNKPVIAIGSQEENPTQLIENIQITGIEVDGNKSHQDNEFDKDYPWIRNNGIDVRGVRRLTIENVVVHDNRSGGLVVSWGSSDIYVSNSSFNNNYYDGLAYYASKRIYTQNCTMISNNNAAISLDNNFQDSIFSGCILDSNGDVGIFARYSEQVRFYNCVIKNSDSFAAYLSHDESGKGVKDIMFSGCQILNNRDGGIYVGSTDNKSVFTSVVGCVFRANGGIAIRSEGSVIWKASNIEMQ
jgi:hypothetical protein